MQLWPDIPYVKLNASGEPHQRRLYEPQIAKFFPK